jgi:hypothetical protein
MLRDDAVRQRQAYAVTGGLGGEEGNENFLNVGRANSLGPYRGYSQRPSVDR